MTSGAYGTIISPEWFKAMLDGINGTMNEKDLSLSGTEASIKQKEVKSQKKGIYLEIPSIRSMQIGTYSQMAL